MQEMDELTAKNTELAGIEACLGALPLFRALSQQERADLATRVRVEEHQAEATLFLQDAPGDSYYIVNQGEVEITVNLPAGKESDGTLKFKKIRKIYAPGGAFGEMSLLTGAARAGDAKTIAKSRLLVIDKAPFRELLLANQTIAAELGATLLRILEINQTASAEDYDPTLTQEYTANHEESGPPSVIIEVQEDQDSMINKIKNFFGLT